MIASRSSARATLPPPRVSSAEARARVRAVIGQPDSRDAGLPLALRRETRRYWQRYVEPLIDVHWPEVRSLPFYRKFQVGAQNVYAPAPYTVVVIAKNRPRVLRLFNALSRALGVPRRMVVWGLELMLPACAALLLRRENRRIALMAAFIALVDEAFDHHLADVPPSERGRLLDEVLRGVRAPPTPSFALVRAIRVALEEGCDEEECRELDAAMQGCVAWGEAEVRNLLGEEDPSGMCHRRTGILTGIDGLAWSVRRFITGEERSWMYNVSEFIQMLDDWVDIEKDAADGVRTPVQTGAWTLEHIAERYEQTSATVARIVADNGEHYPPYVRLARDSYRHQVQDLLELMLKGVAD